MNKLLAVLTGAMLVVASTAAANAQGALSANVREGFYGSIGIAYGAMSVSCSGCGGSSTDGNAGYLALGGTLNPHLRLGFELDAWTKSQQGVTLSIAYYLASASWYPSLDNNLWFKGNLGFTKAYASGYGSSASSNGGFAAGIGAGYDWMPGKGKFAIIPYVNYMAQLSASSSEGKVNVFQVGVGFGYKH